MIAALESTRFVRFALPPLHRHSATEIPSGLIKPAVQSVHSTLAVARKHADLLILFLVLHIKLRLIEIEQRGLKVRGKALPEVNHSNPLI